MAHFFKERVEKEILKLKEKMYKVGTIVEDEMHRIVAIDTGKLDDSIITNAPEINNNTVSVEIGSENVEYAKYVNKSITKKNYHRHGNIVYTGKGQDFLKRALKNKKDEILSMMLK